MTTIHDLEDLDRRIIGSLDEAGEDDATALVNTVLTPRVRRQELSQFIESLRRLANHELIEFANTRDAKTLNWIVMSQGVTNDLLSAFVENVEWSAEETRWNWTADEPRLVVLLSAVGKQLSAEILRKLGWRMTEYE